MGRVLRTADVPGGTGTMTLYARWIPAIWGDVDGDGRVLPMDAFLLNLYLVGHDLVGAGMQFNRILANVFYDSVLDALDLLMLQLYTAGHPVPLGPQTGGGRDESMSMSTERVSISASHAIDAGDGYVDVVFHVDEMPSAGLSVLEFDVEFDDAVLELVRLTSDAGALPMPVLPPLGANPLRLIFMDMFDPMVEPGALLTARFRVLGEVPAGAPVVLRPGAAADGSFNMGVAVEIGAGVMVE